MFLKYSLVLLMLSLISNAVAAPIFSSSPMEGSLIQFNSDTKGSKVSQIIKITNNSNDPLQITSAVFNLINANNFAFSETTASFPLIIPAGSSSSLAIICTPNLTSYLTYANLDLTTNDPLKPSVSYPLACTRNSTGIIYESYPPQNSDLESFGNVYIGTNKSRNIEIFNVGDTAMSISSISFSGDHASSFNIILNPTSPLEGGSNTRLTISCSPQKLGTLKANLNITTNASNLSSITYGLTCNGVENNAPVDITLDNQVIDGGTPENTFVANISTYDKDSSDSHSYQLTDKNNLFMIKNNQLWTAAHIPLSVNNGGLSVTIKSTDNGGLFIEKTFQIMVNSKVGAQFSSKPLPNNLIDLGKTLVLTSTLGQTNTGQLEIIETGDMDLKVSSSISGIDAIDFKVSPTEMILFDGSPSKFLTIECTPSMKGVRQAQLQLSTNVTNTPNIFTYPLQCEGIESESFTSIPAFNQPWTLGKISVGQTISQTLQIIKTKDMVLNLTPTLKGAHVKDFNLSPNSSISIDGILPINFKIECTPSEQGLRTATLEFSTNDLKNPLIFYSLECEGIPPTMFSSNPPAGSMIFFNSDSQGTPVSNEIQISNFGNQSLTINSLNVQGGAYAETFSILNGKLPINIEPQMSFSLNLKCTPSSELLQGGFLHLTTNDAENPEVTYGLACLKKTTGAVYVSLPRVNESIYFNNVTDNRPEIRSLFILNAGDTPFSITKINLSGINQDVFKIVNVSSFPLNISGGDVKRVDIECNPTQEGISLADLNILYDATMARRNVLTATYPLICRKGVNHPPTDILLSNEKITPETPANTLIADISTLDLDINERQTYSLQDNSGFFVVKGRQLFTAKNIPPGSIGFDIVLKSIDSGGLFIEKKFHLVVDNLFNQFRAEIITPEGMKSSVDETELITAKGYFQPLAKEVGRLADVFAIYRYISLSNAVIEIPVTLLRNIPLQAKMELLLYQGRLIYLPGKFEIILGYRINGNESKGLATVFSVRKNAPPLGFELSRNTIVERSPAGTVVGKFITQDMNKNDFFRYVLIKNAGTPFGYFKIVGDELQIAESFPIVFRENATLEIGVRVIDSAGGFLDKNFTIKVIENDIPHLGGEIRSNNYAIRGTKGQLATLMKNQLFTVNAWIQPPSIHLRKAADILYKIVFTPISGEMQIFEGIWEKDRLLSSAIDIEMAKDFSLDQVGTYEVSIGYRLKDGTFQVLTPFQKFRVHG